MDDDEWEDDEPVFGSFCDNYTIHVPHVYRAINGSIYSCGGVDAVEYAAYIEEASRPPCEHGMSASLCAGPMHYPMDR